MPSFINIFNKRISDTGVKSKWEKVQSGLLVTGTVNSNQSGRMHKPWNPCDCQEIIENKKISDWFWNKKFVNYWKKFCL
ncbi:hypothetical protein DXD67_07060 [Coprococcus comes]|uniref:Uncharacterized protein n=2 Tax=Coprococcus comes TaxID=410072 RepID=A0A3E4GR56_9FIRM|nr:hypothetical protein DXD67_07060 [Coprococcus comes]